MGCRSSWTRSLSGGALGLLLLACAVAPSAARAEPLYLALELRQAGEIVARPKLLGDTGKTIRAERRSPGRAVADYQLVLHPRQSAEDYRLELELILPGGARQSELAIAHGEERRVQLGSRPGELELSVLLMKVDSPEFRALMRLDAPSAESQRRPAAI